MCDCVCVCRSMQSTSGQVPTLLNRCIGQQGDKSCVNKLKRCYETGTCIERERRGRLDQLLLGKVSTVLTYWSTLQGRCPIICLVVLESVPSTGWNDDGTHIRLHP